MRKATLLLILLACLATVWLGARAQAPALPADASAQVAQRVESYLRYVFAWGPEYQVSVGPLRESVIPGLYSALVRVRAAQGSLEEVVLLNADGRYIVRGDLYDSTVDPFAAVRNGIDTNDHPSLGPADAPVTIVEYGDFQCPTCAQMHPVLKEVLAENKNVRLVFKDFPLTQIHNWSMAAAVAGQCAYRQSNDRFWRLHDYFFENQKQLTPENLDARLDAFASQARFNLEQFRACRQQQLTRSRVDQSIEEGTRFNVSHTPTLFTNGRPSIEAASKDFLTRLIKFELRLREQGTAQPEP